jgi:hypothetical protein
MTAGITLWVFVSVGLASVDRANNASIPGAWLFIFVIGLVPVAGVAGLCGMLIAVLGRKLSSDDRERHIRLVRLLTPVVIGAVSGLFVLLAAVSGRDGVRWWTGVAFVSLAMGIPATFAAWWRTPAIVAKYWPSPVVGAGPSPPAG